MQRVLQVALLAEIDIAVVRQSGRIKIKTDAFALAFVSKKNVRDVPSRSFTTILVEAAVMNPGSR